MRSLPLLLSLRFSQGRRHVGMLSLISIISTLGIALGVAVLIIGLSAMNGFERELDKRILSVVPHGEIEPVSPPSFHWEALIPMVEKIPGIVAASPYVAFTGLLESGNQIRAIQLKGIDPTQEDRTSALSQFVQGDAWADFSAGEKQIILGRGVAKSLGIKPGDWLTLMIPNHDEGNKLLKPRRIPLQVRGLLQLSGVLDYTLALIPLADAQSYMELGKDVTGIALKMNDPFRAVKLVRNAAEATGTDVYIRSWIGTYGYMYRDIQMIRAIMYLAMVLVIGIACFNIVSTLIMAVKEKHHDIAILRTLGAGNAMIRKIFIWYGLRTGLVGSAIGTIIGVLIALKLTSIASYLEKITGRSLLADDVYFINFLPSELHAVDVFFVLGTAFLLSLLASGYPAWRASRIDPARVLSGK